MPVMDEFREEREAIKNGTPKEKWDYFWSYYKWHVIVSALAVFFVVSLIVQIANRKENAFFVAMVNGIELISAEEYVQNFSDYIGIDTTKYQVVFDASMRINIDSLNEETITSREKLMVYIAAQDIDVMVSNESVFQQYAYNDTFYDLRDLLTEEQISAYSQNFYYLDQAVMDAKTAAQNALDYSYEPEYPNPASPESMKDPIPVGIYLEDTNPLRDCYYYDDQEHVIVGVILNTLSPETASMYIDYIMQ